MTRRPGGSPVPEILDEEIDLEREVVRDSHGRRIDAAYDDRAVADVHAQRGRPVTIPPCAR